MLIECDVKTKVREELVDVTPLLREALAKSGLREGTLLAYVPHTTAALTINENADPDVVRDILTSLRRLVPERGDYHHAEGNSDAHLKTALLGSSVTLIVHEGALMLGRWQSVFFCEFDGPRARKLWVKVGG